MITLNQQLYRLCTILLILAPSFLISASYASNTKQPSSSTVDCKWEPLIWHDGKLIGIGSRQLPIPLVLPKNLSPLGNKAIISIGPGSKDGYWFDIFFPAAQEKSVHDWAARQPVAFPLPRSTYVRLIPEKAKMKPFPDRGWVCAMSGKTSWGDISFLWIGTSANPAAKQSGPPSNWMALIYEPGSPVERQARIVQLGVVVVYSHKIGPRQLDQNH